MPESPLSNLSAGFKKSDMLRRLIYINIAVFLLINLYLILVKIFGLESWLQFTGADLFMASTSDISELILRPWSVITYMFAHKDVWHIAGNLLILYIFGQIFQDFVNQRKLLSTYLLGGLSGFLLYFIAFNLIDTLPVNSSIIGASAAIMAIVIGIATYMPNYKINLIFVGPIKLQYIALFYVILDLISIRDGNNTGGHIGHVGGALYGYFWGMQMRKGIDISQGFENFLDRFFLWFKPGGAKFRVIRNKKDTRSGRVKTDEEFNAEKKKNQERLDTILDKISKGGYDSLTSQEKEFLFRHSK